MREVSILSNVTIGIIGTKLRKKYKVYIPGGFNTLASEIYNPSSQLYKQKSDAIFLLIDGYESKNWFSNSEAKKYYDEWCSVVRAITSNIKDKLIFISTISIEGNRIGSYSEKTFFRDWENNWYNFIQAISESNRNVYVFDIVRRIYDIGKNNFYSPKMWYMGSMPYSKLGIETICQEIDYAMLAAFEKRQKGVALDLDNTLWGGVIGEDGPEGIVLSNHKEGERFYDLQAQLLEMKNRGVIMAVLSKNNVNDVEPAWSNPNMLIKKDDLVASVIDWNEKSQNLLSIQNDLNLTSYSFVFIDDNPVEREKMKEAGFAVVPDFPDDTANLRQFAIDCFNRYFRVLRVTSEDKKKTQMYQQEMGRKEMGKQSSSFDDYLTRLELSVDIHFIEENEVERVTQLINKSNQFNVTTKRYTESEIINMMKANNVDIFTVHSSDKFGDNGLVSIIICNKIGSAIEIDSFLMSCRVMGRKLENVIISCLANYYLDSYEVMNAKYIKSEKNKAVEELFDKLGFELINCANGIRTYRMKLKDKMKGVEQYKNVAFLGNDI